MYKRVHGICMPFSEQSNILNLNNLLLKIFIAHPQDENILLHIFTNGEFSKTMLCSYIATVPMHIPYSAIIGRGKIWAKSLPERMVGKYLVNLHLNKTICAYIINNYCSEAFKNSVLEVFSSKRYFTKLLQVCNLVCSSEYICIHCKRGYHI